MKIKNIKSVLMAMLLIIVMSLIAVDAQAAYTVKQIFARMSATAGETLTVGQLVAIADADGYAYKADADVSTRRPAVGIVGKAATSGNKVEIVIVGIVSGWSSLAEGAEGYLSATAGAVTQSAPTYSQQVGIAISTTDYFINAKNYYDTSGLLTQVGAGSYSSYTLDTNNVTLATTDCGEVHAIATDAKVYTLPATAAGCVFRFINAGAAGNNILVIDPDAADQIFGSCASVDIAGAAGEKLQNTQATAIRGDSVTLIGDGADGWYVESCNGVWAEETP